MTELITNSTLVFHTFADGIPSDCKNCMHDCAGLQPTLRLGFVNDNLVRTMWAVLLDARFIILAVFGNALVLRSIGLSLFTSRNSNSILIPLLHSSDGVRSLLCDVLDIVILTVSFIPPLVQSLSGSYLFFAFISCFLSVVSSLPPASISHSFRMLCSA